MLYAEFCTDFTIDAEIVHEFHVDEMKVKNLKRRINDSITSCKGLLGKIRKKKLESFLTELDLLQPYYITDNGYLYTFNYWGGIKGKLIYDLRLCYDLSKKGHNYIEHTDNCIISSYVDSNGVGNFGINEDGTEEGQFGADSGIFQFLIWNVYEPDMYSILKNYITADDITKLDSISEFDMD